MCYSIILFRPSVFISFRVYRYYNIVFRLAMIQATSLYNIYIYILTMDIVMHAHNIKYITVYHHLQRQNTVVGIYINYDPVRLLS